VDEREIADQKALKALLDLRDLRDHQASKEKMVHVENLVMGIKEKRETKDQEEILGKEENLVRMVYLVKLERKV